MNSFVEPWLLKTIHLLHSSHPDATEQLKTLHERSLEPDGEAQIQKITLSEVMKEHSNANANAAAASGAASSRSSSVSRSIGMKIASVEFSSDHSSDSIPEKKRPKLALVNIFDNVVNTSGTNSTTGTSSSTVGSIHHKSQTNVSTISGPSAKTKRSSGSALSFPSNPETIIVEDLVADLNCCVCHTMTIDRSDNSLIECSQCSKLYHQLCHVPPIIKPKSSNSWLCVECTSKVSRK